MFCCLQHRRHIYPIHRSSTSAQLSKYSLSSTNTAYPPCFLYSKYLRYCCLQSITEIATRQLVTSGQLVSDQLLLCSTGITSIPAGSFIQENRQRCFVLCRKDAHGVAMAHLCLPGVPMPCQPTAPCHAMPWGSGWPLAAPCHGGWHGGRSMDPLPGTANDLCALMGLLASHTT